MGSAARKLLENARRENRAHLLEPEAKAVCVEYGIPVPPFEAAKSSEEAGCIARRLGFPVVLKIASPDILHKTEAHGVLLGLMDEESFSRGFSQITYDALSYKREARVGAMVQKMAPKELR